MASGKNNRSHRHGLSGAWFIVPDRYGFMVYLANVPSGIITHQKARVGRRQSLARKVSFTIPTMSGPKVVDLFAEAQF